MLEPLLFGIVLGLIPVTLIGLFVAAFYNIAAEINLVYKNFDERDNIFLLSLQSFFLLRKNFI